MDKVRTFFGKIKRHLRTCVQIVFTLFTNGYLKGFQTGRIYNGKAKALCLPGLNCYSCPGALGSCPIGALQATLTSRDYQFAFYVGGFLLLIGTVLGRFVCGFLCPFGLVQDLIYKIPFFKKLKKLPGDKFLRFLKYVILFGFVLLLPMFAVDAFGLGKPWFCTWICPSGALMAGIPLTALNAGLRSMIGFLYHWKVGLLVFILLLSVLVYRPFCRYLCPLGAIYGLFHPISLVRIRLDEAKCTHCTACHQACDMDIDPVKTPNSPECIRCGKCVSRCPQGALSMGIKIPKKPAAPSAADSEP